MGESETICLICLAPMIEVEGVMVCKREHQVVELDEPYEEEPQ